MDKVKSSVELWLDDLNGDLSLGTLEGEVLTQNADYIIYVP